MKTSDITIDEQEFRKTASEFFDVLFRGVLENEYGDIEIRTFSKDSHASMNFHSTVETAVDEAYDLCKQGISTYFGVNPRRDKGGKKSNIQFVSSFHADIDYGSEGHGKKMNHESYDEAIATIKGFHLTPTYIIHSGNGFHCYWVLENPVSVEDVGVNILENINKSLLAELKGDMGTHDISRVLRVPGTVNFKDPKNPKETRIIEYNDVKYSLRAFSNYMNTDDEKSDTKKRTPNKSSEICPEPNYKLEIDDILDDLPILPKTKELILKGDNGEYSSRSEADMAVLGALLKNCTPKGIIRKIFNTQTIGEKYRNHSNPEEYLSHSIENVKDVEGLTEEEILNPVFIMGAIYKIRSKYKLNIVRFQEYMVKKFKLKFDSGVCFKYNGMCYEPIFEDEVNHLCQTELKFYRNLFSRNLLKDFHHFTVGDAFVGKDKVEEDQQKYFTFLNGHFNVEDGSLIKHTPQIFTTNLLPYEYDPNAKCERFLQFLYEIFEGNQETIDFVQQAIGYSFHKSIPTPALFFYVGIGSNGKSVLLDIITYLVGEHNCCSVNLNDLSKEQYLLQLFSKMINVSSETPMRKNLDSNYVKMVVAGDLVSAKQVYKPVVQFRPYAKHFIAMNELPTFNDTSYGMFRRLYIIEFPRVFTKRDMDTNLIHKLRKELPGIFNWAFQGYLKLKANKFIFNETAAMQAIKKQYRDSIDSVRAFESEWVSKKRGSNLIFKDMFNAYERFCESQGYDSLSRIAFRKKMVSFGYKIGNVTNGGNHKYFLNTVVKNLKNPSSAPIESSTVY
ncbi:phage/plasmid primase, P4 family [candidate division KSB1 bacterium]